MTDFRRYSLTAVVLLVILRVGIGWQLLYEGLWKIDTLSSQTRGHQTAISRALRDHFAICSAR